jgi:diguanylate cyclase (GGDEF)-like protein
VIEKNYHMEKNSPVKYAFLPVMDQEGKVTAVLSAGFNLNGLMRLQIVFAFAIVFFLLLSLGCWFILRFLLDKTVIEPVLELNRGMKIIAGGKLEHVIKINSKNEIGELAENFNRMTRSLKDGFEKIEASNRNLLVQLLTDPLTKTPNRKKFMDDLALCSNPVVVIFNVDGFQEINDFYGTEAGDLLLKEMAYRLKSLNLGIPFRLYKMHADEYIILIDREADMKELEYWGIYFSEEVMASPIIYRGTEIFINVSLGIGFARMEKPEKRKIDIGREALRNADMALKRAKSSRKKFIVYQDYMEISKEYEDNIFWTKKLKNAIMEDRILPYFQPILNNHTGAIDKYECLMRMVDLNGDIIAPLKFLNTAKKARLYRYLTKMMLEKSFAFFRDYEFEFSINISLEDIMDEKTVGYLYELLKSFEDCTCRAVFELLETENLENYIEVIEFINYVKNLGCKIAIDDFGTGYSNFSHLINMHVDYIKIDSSLIKNINKDKNSQIITRTIATFARELGLQTISEFVYSKEVFDKCQEMGIDYSQGYYLGEPKNTLVMP